MLTVQTVENINLGSKITMFNGIYALIIGVLSLGFMFPILRMNFRAVDVIWQVFSKYNPELSKMILELLVLKAIFIITMGIVIIYLSTFILRKKDKTAWVILFVIGIFFWPSLLTMEILEKNFYTITASFIGWLTFIMGMIIPIKYYLQKETSDYY